MLDQPLWQFAVAIALSVIGLYALLLGRFTWRRGTEKRCTACEYELQGLPDTSTRCPECGADLQRRWAVGYGSKRGKLVSRVVALLLLVSVGRWWTKLVTADDLLYVQPVRFMLRDVTGRNPRADDAVLERLTLQIHDGRLWPWQVRALVREAAARHADPNQSWTPAWMRLVGMARDRNRIDAATYQAFSRNATTVTITVRPSIEQGGRLPVLIQPTMVRGINTFIWGGWSFAVQSARIDGKPIDPSGIAHASLPDYGYAFGDRPIGLDTRDLLPGQYELAATIATYDGAISEADLKNALKADRRVGQVHRE